MTRAPVTVAIPILNAGPGLVEVLRAVRAQRLDRELELLVCDSGSTDGSEQLARQSGATVIAIAPGSFSHGGTRNLLMQRASGEHVAFLTQDAVPAHESWLDGLLSGFRLAPDVGLVFGPYRPRADASPMVARELTRWFESFAPDGRARIDRLTSDQRDLVPRALLGPRGFFTDANGCVARSAWEQVPFRRIRYAEDHALAHDMMRSGYAKAFVPGAAVVHSHDYSNWGWLQRSFDEARAMQDLYDWRRPLNLRTVTRDLWGLVGADWRWTAASADAPAAPVQAAVLLARSSAYHLARISGAIAAGRADRLSPSLVRHLSREQQAR